jgi:hypothetical protein
MALFVPELLSTLFSVIGLVIGCLMLVASVAFFVVRSRGRFRTYY